MTAISRHTLRDRTTAWRGSSLPLNKPDPPGAGVATCHYAVGRDQLIYCAQGVQNVDTFDGMLHTPLILIDVIQCSETPLFAHNMKHLTFDGDALMRRSLMPRPLETIIVHLTGTR
jgi:hypothetical protein